jgi:hypothetical protein
MIFCRGTNDTDRQTHKYLPHYSGISSHSKELVFYLWRNYCVSVSTDRQTDGWTDGQINLGGAG